MPIIEELRRNPEPLPDWLQDADLRFNRENFFSSRTLYYPGSRIDGFPIRVCSIAHAVHTFVYVDFLAESAQEIMENVHNFEGIYEIERLDCINEELVCPKGWHPRQDLELGYGDFDLTDPYYLYVVLCRREDKGECDGPKKIAILFIGRDGFEAFDILYCQYELSPYLIVVQDHFGYAGDIFDEENYRFDDAGILRQYAQDSNVQPELLLVGHNSTAWRGYQYTGATDVPRAEDCTGLNDRRLYRRKRCITGVWHAILSACNFGVWRS